jgi:hypothetical protein
MARELSAREQALRSLPLPYSLALRLRDAGVAPEVVCEYLDVEEDALAGIYRMAEAKLRRTSAQKSPTPRERVAWRRGLPERDLNRPDTRTAETP